MSRVLTTVSVGALFALAAPDVGEAQACTGQAEFGRYALQASLSAEFNSDAKTLGGGIAVGGRKVFAGIAATRTTYDNIGGSTITMGGGLGYQIPLDRQHVFQLCPLASVAFGIGPKNVDISGNGTVFADLSETDLLLGMSGSASIALSPISTTRFVPNASVSVVSATAHLRNDVSGVTTSDSRTFELLDLGAGWVFDQGVALVPGMTIPIGLSGASTTFHVVLSLNVARYAH